MTTVGYWLFLFGSEGKPVLGSMPPGIMYKSHCSGPRCSFWATRLLTIRFSQYFAKPFQVVFNLLVDYFRLYYWSTRVYDYCFVHIGAWCYRCELVSGTILKLLPRTSTWLCDISTTHARLKIPSWGTLWVLRWTPRGSSDTQLSYASAPPVLSWKPSQVAERSAAAA